MICKGCRDAGNLNANSIEDKAYISAVWHRNCKGGTWCDCQHKTEAMVRK